MFLSIGSILSWPSKPRIDLQRAELIFIIGPPGAGKGTQCKRLAEELSITHYSAGDLLRGETRNQSSQWRADRIIEYRANRDTLKLPIEIYSELLRDRIYSDTKEGKALFLIDGYPRTMEHLAAFSQYNPNVKGMIYFECSAEVCLPRVEERGRTSGRPEDNKQMFLRRYARFMEGSLPLLEHFEQEGLLRTIDCTREEDEVYEEFSSLVKDVFGLHERSLIALLRSAWRCCSFVSTAMFGSP